MTADEKRVTAFHSMLDKNPADWTARLVFADLLEELERFAEARCQRWLVKNGRRPNRNGWVWDWCHKDYPGHRAPEDDPCRLPEDLFRRLGVGIRQWSPLASAKLWVEYVSRQLAEADLCRVLKGGLRWRRRLR